MVVNPRHSSGLQLEGPVRAQTADEASLLNEPRRRSSPDTTVRRRDRRPTVPAAE
jgi:hypothetical protein